MGDEDDGKKSRNRSTKDWKDNKDESDGRRDRSKKNHD